MALRIAGLQTAGRPGDVEANLAELERAAATACRPRRGVAHHPGLFLTGYDVGDALYSLAAQPLLERACTIAREHDIALIVGLPEVAPAGRLYNSAVFIDHTGEVLARYARRTCSPSWTAGTSTPVTMPSASSTTAASGWR